MELIKEILEEAKDFFEDIFEHIFEHKERVRREKSASSFEMTIPAFLFAERVDNLLRVIFGISIIVSAIIASVWGFTAVGDMVRFMINTILGRVFLGFVGLSYLLTGVWRFFHLRRQ